MAHSLWSEHTCKIFWLGSCHGRVTGPLLQENLGNKFHVVRPVMPNSPLENVSENLGKLGKDIDKLGHIIFMFKTIL
jgi:hypothetical protein